MWNIFGNIIIILSGRAWMESIHYDSPKWMKDQKRLWFAKWIKNVFFYFWFTWANHFIFYNDSFWFGMILSRGESRFTRESKSNRIKNLRQVNPDLLISNDLVDSISKKKRIKVNRESSWSESCSQVYWSHKKMIIC